MGLTVKRELTLEKLFDQFAVDPDQKETKDKTDKRENEKNSEKKETEK